MADFQEEENKFSFRASESIFSTDGWLTPTGEFYSCRSDQHDECAKFVLGKFRSDILKLHLTEEEKEDIDKLPARMVLGRYGHVLLSHGQAELPELLLKAEQIKLLMDAGIHIPKKETADLHTFVRVDFDDETDSAIDLLREKIDLILGIQEKDQDAGVKNAGLSVSVQTGKLDVIGDRKAINMDWGTITLRFSRSGIDFIKFDEMFDWTDFTQNAEELREAKESGKHLTQAQEEFLEGKLYGNDLSERINPVPVLLLGFAIPQELGGEIEKDSDEQLEKYSSLKKHGVLVYATKWHDYGGIEVSADFSTKSLTKDQILELLRIYLNLIHDFPRTPKVGKPEKGSV